MITQIDAPTLAQALHSSRALAVLDVREPWEFATANMTGAVNIPMQTVPSELDAIRALQGEGELVLVCHHGSRSMHVANFLASNGFEGLINLRGGIAAWSAQVDPSVPTY